MWKEGDEALEVSIMFSMRNGLGGEDVLFALGVVE